MSDHESRPISRLELIAVWLFACVGLPLAMVVLSGPRLFTRPFWSDEVLSWLIASDASLGHGLAALAGGVDTNAPLLHVLLHVIGHAWGHTPLVYRTLGAAGMCIAILGLYFTLRRSFERTPVAVGCLAFLCWPLVLVHTTEARFYSLFLAAAIWCAYWLMRRLDRPTLANAVAVAMLSSVLCAVHYFGIVALGAMAACGLLVGRSIRDRLWAIFPTLAGLTTTLCFVPLIRAQRGAMAGGGGTWVPDTFILNVRTTLAETLPSAIGLGICVLGFLAIRIAGRREVAAAIGLVPRLLWALPLYAVALLAFDRLVQPVVVPRYFILIVPAVAAGIAAMTSVLPPRAGRAIAACLLCVIAGQLWHMRSRMESPSPRSASGVLATIPPGAVDPVVSDWLGFALPVWQERPALRGRVSYMPDPRLREAGFDASIRYEKKMAEQVQLFYGIPASLNVSDVDRLDRFVLLSEFPETVAERFPRFRARQLGAVTFEMTAIRLIVLDH